MKTISEMIEKIEKNAAVSAIKRGLIMVIPVLMIGSTSLVFVYFPISAYQSFIASALSGRLLSFFNLIYNATFGMLSVYLTCAISFCYARQYSTYRVSLASPITALICFFVFSGVGSGEAAWEALGVKGVFIAIISALLATRLLRHLSTVHESKHVYAADQDVEFNHSVSVILPAAGVVAIFAAVDLVVTSIFHVESFFDLFVSMANALFMPLGRSFLSAMLLVLCSSLFWFFGIHGSDVLESVTENLFTPAIGINIDLINAGQAPTEIFTKQFFDVFILMGGCGTAMCLFLAVLLFSKRRRNRRLCRLAVVPLLFNINELFIFGFPVIYNTTLLLPFILTPLFSFVSTYFAMSTGLVPMTISQVNWTAPVLLSGYTATGSVAGSLLQLFNIVVGVLIYRPFVKRYDSRCDREARRTVSELTKIKQESESSLVPVTLTSLNDAHGSLARSLSADLKYAMDERDLRLFYQPQYDDKGSCVGIESLLRWKHPLYGMIYPPLIIQLASETGMLTALETYVLERAVNDAAHIRAETGYRREISVNVCAATIVAPEYFEKLKEYAESGMVKNGDICLEVTEQTALLSDEQTFEYLRRIKSMGYLLAIDDFSMGHTSLTYLQESCFDVVKLDGSLVTDMLNNPRSYDIIKTITGLAKKLGFSVTAEYVETREQVDMLQAADCFQYQGYLFSPAVETDALIKRLSSERDK